MDIPPRKPPQVIIKLVLRTKPNFLEKNLIGNHNDAYLQINTRGTAIKPATNGI